MYDELDGTADAMELDAPPLPPVTAVAAARMRREHHGQLTDSGPAKDVALRGERRPIGATPTVNNRREMRSSYVHRRRTCLVVVLRRSLTALHPNARETTAELAVHGVGPYFAVVCNKPFRGKTG